MTTSMITNWLHTERQKWARYSMQVLALILIWCVAQTITSWMHWPLPGSMLGLLTLWTFLELGLIKLDWIEHGADGLLNHLMLFFVPAMLALVNHPEFLSLLGVKLLLSVIISTVIVMCGTACVIEFGFRLSYARSR